MRFLKNLSLEARAALRILKNRVPATRAPYNEAESDGDSTRLEDNMHYVVGSGPTGVACARALLAQGVQVTMLDAGLQLEPEREAQIRSLQALPFAEWASEAGKFLKDGMESGAEGIPVKLTYGSDYPYRVPPGAAPVEFRDASASPSYAIGGLSTVWGSAVMPYHQRDMVRWPISAEDLAEGYRAIFRWMPLSAIRDDLDRDFPLYCDHPGQLATSRQASGMLADLEKHKARLTSSGISFGKARIAVAADGYSGSPACVTCGLCMYGCPYRLIYSTEQTVEELKADPNFHYVPSVVVRSVEEGPGSVTIHAGQAKFSGERVYLAAGVYSTTAILLRSMHRFNQPVRLHDSQYFLLPALRGRGSGNVTRERLHTLAQLFLEITDRAISPHTIHLQAYTYNDLFRAPIEQKLGPLRPLFPMDAFLSRLFLYQGYLHSDHSAQLEATLVQRGSGDALEVTGVVDSETKPTLKKVVRKLASLSTALGSVPLSPLLKIGEPGRGYHSGGSFPMSSHPSEGQSDIFGRPAGFARVHAVDSTVFPSIAATTITLTAMANAWRIGSMLKQYA